MNTLYKEKFSVLTENLRIFVQEVLKKKLTLKATEDWTVKDELSHIVFWHEMYAANYKAQVEQTFFELPEEMSTINKRGVRSLRTCSRRVLLDRLYKAHNSLYTSIVEHNIKSMTYSKGGRTYETAAFLDMISRHFLTHARQVKRAR